MKLTWINVHRFRNIDSFTRDIGDGIVLFKGPNEAGKSSLLSALLFGLFEDPRSSAQRFEEARGWSKESLYTITLKFNNKGETYLLEKDFENRSTLLRNEANNESWKDKNRVNAKLTEILGFFSKDVFISSACVFQDELYAISSGQKELRTLLEKKVAGKEESAVEPVLRLLEKKVLELKRGLDRPAPANPGQLRQVIDGLSGLKERREEIAHKVSRLHGARGRVNEVINELEEVTNSMELKRQALEKSRLYVKSKERHENLKGSLEKTLANLEKLIKADQEIEKMKSMVENKRIRFKASQENLGKHRVAAKMKAEKEALETELNRKKEIMNRAGEIVGMVDGLKKSSAGLPMVPEKLVRDLLQAESDIRALGKSVGQRTMLLTVAFKNPVPYKIETEDGILSTGEGAAGETLEGRAKKEFHIDFTGVAEVGIVTRDTAIEESLKEIKEKEDLLKDQLKRHRCGTVTELVAMKESRDHTWRQLEAKEAELKLVLGKDTMTSLTKEVSELETRLEKINRAFEEREGFAISEEELARREEETQKLGKEVQELEGHILANRAVLQTFDKEELEKEKRDLARDVLVTETALDDLKAFESSGEEVIKRENEFKTLEQKLSDLSVERQTLEHILQEDRYGQEDVAELEERIEFLERRAGRLRMTLGSYEIIGEVLTEARQNILKSISGQVDEQISAYFALITGGKYDQVRLSRENFSLQVFSKEKDDWINPDREELSGGARDQLYLAARLALVDVITGGHSIPLIMDDPLVHFDASRRKNTGNLIRDVSKRHQVLLFSCHDYYDEWADQIIRF